MSALLDVNALVALTWPTHVHHQAVQRWFKAHAAEGWATCAFTQAALARLSLQPAVAGRDISAEEVGDLLVRLTSHERHQALVIDFDFAAVLQVCSAGIWGHRQVTDAWLLCAAVHHGVRLVTFDAGVSQLLATPAERERHVLTLAA